MILEMSVEEANEIKSRPVLSWHEIAPEKPHLTTIRIFQYGDDPEIVYIFQSGYTNPELYHVIFEDGYESPIVHQFWTKETIKQNLNIDL